MGDKAALSDTPRVRKTVPPARLRKIEARLLKAEAPAQIVAALSAEWGKSERTLWRYVAMARKRIASRLAEQDPTADAQIARSMLLEAYQTARTGGLNGPDAKAMVAAAKVYAEVTGAAAPSKRELSGPGGAPLQHELVARVVVLPPLDGPAPAATPGSVVEPERGPANGLPPLDSE